MTENPKASGLGGARGVTVFHRVPAVIPAVFFSGVAAIFLLYILRMRCRSHAMPMIFAAPGNSLLWQRCRKKETA